LSEQCSSDISRVETFVAMTEVSFQGDFIMAEKKPLMDRKVRDAAVRTLVKHIKAKGKKPQKVLVPRLKGWFVDQTQSPEVSPEEWATFYAEVNTQNRIELCEALDIDPEQCVANKKKEAVFQVKLDENPAELAELLEFSTDEDSDDDTVPMSVKRVNSILGSVGSIMDGASVNKCESAEKEPTVTELSVMAKAGTRGRSRNAEFDDLFSDGFFDVD